MMHCTFLEVATTKYEAMEKAIKYYCNKYKSEEGWKLTFQCVNEIPNDIINELHIENNKRE